MRELVEALPVIQGLATALIPIVGMALSYHERLKVRHRDSVCQINDGTPHEGILEASHLNHKKGHVEGIPYDDARRCILMCTLHHLDYHIGTSLDVLGLNQYANDFAIDALTKRLEKYESNDGEP